MMIWQTAAYPILDSVRPSESADVALIAITSPSILDMDSAFSIR